MSAFSNSHQPSPLYPRRSEDYNDRMEQRERDKKSRQILSQQFLPDTTEELPLFNAPIRVAQSDDRIQRQLGMFEIAMPLLDKYIGVQGPSQMRSANPSAHPPYPHMSSAAGYNSSNREGYANSRSHHAIGSNSNHSGAATQPATLTAPLTGPSFLKPKEAPPPPLNGMSRYSSSQQQHNRPMMHDVSQCLSLELILFFHANSVTKYNYINTIVPPKAD